MKVYLALSLLLVLVSGLSARAITVEKGGDVGDIWSNCGKSSDVCKLNGLVITPDPPVKGKDIKATANITTNEGVTGGEIVIKVKWGFISVVDDNVKVCDALKDAGLACPLKAGTYSVGQTVTLPSEAPSGHYTGSAVGTGADGKQLFCVNLDFHM